jgi:predicted dehydrogenase
MSGKVFHAPLISAHDGFSLVKIVQRRGDEAHKAYPGTTVVRSVDEVFSDPYIELVVVNTTNDTHFDFTGRALKAGKHVVVEKPFTHTVADGQRLIDLASRQKKVLSVFQNRRWDSDFRTVQKVIADGSIGRVAEFESNFDRYRNYIQPDTWKEETGPGSGLLYNLGPHLIDQAIVLFGKPGAVFADIRKIRDHTTVDDYFEITLFYEKVKVRLHSSYLVRSPNPRFVVHGTLGSFIKYGLDPQEEDLKKGGIPGSPGWGEESANIRGTLETEIGGSYRKEKIKSERGNYLEYYDGLFRAIREKKPFAVTAEEALLNIHAIELAYRSNNNRTVVEFKR